MAKHAELLRRDARRHSRTDHAAEDALSGACEIFLTKFKGPVSDPLHPLRWLRVVVKHSAWEIGRRERRFAERTQPEGPDGFERITPRVPEEPYTAVDEGTELRQLLGALKPDERRALMMLAAGYSYREIADHNDWTLTKVNRCLAEGRAKLRAARGER